VVAFDQNLKLLKEYPNNPGCRNRRRDVSYLRDSSRLPSFSRGPDKFQAMLLGLHRTDEHFGTTNFEKNRTSRVENQLLTSTQD
jgi:hypothetical protein